MGGKYAATVERLVLQLVGLKAREISAVLDQEIRATQWAIANTVKQWHDAAGRTRLKKGHADGRERPA